MLPISKNSLLPHEADGARQVMKINNSMEGQKGIVLKIRVNYGLDDGTKVAETRVLSNLPTNY